MIYSCIILVVGIASYGDGYLLACPDTSWTCVVATSKSTHDIRVIIISATFAIVLPAKSEGKVVFAKEVGHVLVE
jgi:hypothetical protein